MTQSQSMPDYAAIKSRQQATWASGNYAVVGSTLQIVGESLCEAVDLKAGERVIDVAAGNGNATLAAARRFADVTSTDYVKTLLDNGAARVKANGMSVNFQEADAEGLPFADGAFDVALSTFGVMFTPNQAVSAREMARVVRSGGRVGLANWTPDSYIGQLFKTIGKYVPPPAGVKSPALWGDEAHLKELFAGHDVQATRKDFVFRYKSPEHWLDVFRNFYGPTHKAFGALDAAGQAALQADIEALMASNRRKGEATLVIPSAYLEVVVTKR